FNADAAFLANQSKHNSIDNTVKEKKLGILTSDSNSIDINKVLTSTTGRTIRSDNVIPRYSASTQWKAIAGESLQILTTRWSESAGYQIVWDVPYDYQIEAGFQLQGDFPQAITQLFDAFINSDRPMKVDIYKQQRLIHIAPL
ncbi:hypothetical protein DVQ78_21365, partial [Yersinia enterocolitica]|nr:hypothetical protein [Yersinia enterocolitica]